MELFRGNYLLLAAALFMGTFVLSAVAVGGVLLLLPATFCLRRERRGWWIDRHPLVRWLALGLKNVAGVLLILVGLALSLPGIPGQGLLTILIGLILVDFPGKHRLERAILGRPRVLERVNRFRARFGRPPLMVPADEDAPPRA